MAKLTLDQLEAAIEELSAQVRELKADEPPDVLILSCQESLEDCISVGPCDKDGIEIVIKEGDNCNTVFIGVNEISRLINHLTKLSNDLQKE